MFENDITTCFKGAKVLFIILAISKGLHILDKLSTIFNIKL